MEDDKNRLSSNNLDNPATDTIPSFLLKTYQILENDKYCDTICWTKNGEGFIVKKVKQFSENILPIYFRHSNYTSFVRQLNMYDFHKTRQENHQNAFKNLMFKRGYKHLLKQIQRKDYKKNKDSTKQPSGLDKNTDKAKEYSRMEKQIGQNYDLGRLNMKKIRQINAKIEKKMLIIAELKEIPEKQLQLIKILDTLFEAKKLHRDLVGKMENLGTFMSDIDQKPKRKNSVEVELTARKENLNKEEPTADPKETKMELPKAEDIGTGVSLFSTFNQV